MKNKVTLVTGLWNINRDSLAENWARTFEFYLSKFNDLMGLDINLIVFGNSEIESFVLEKKNSSNTQVIIKDLEWFKNTTPFDKIQEIRNSQNWINQAGWLGESTQAKLEMYNPLVMSKVFLLNDAKILDKFDSDYLFWIDAGISNTVHPGYFTHDKVLEKLPKYVSKFSFICFPYKASTEVHGFTYPKINEYAGADIQMVARGGFFGGPKDTISEINGLYYDMLNRTLQDGYMGTEESIFSIMNYKYGDKIQYFEINENGLLGTFFENLKNDTLVPKQFIVENKSVTSKERKVPTIGLYVLTFNSPNQVRELLNSFNKADKDLLTKTKKHLVDNSTDETTYLEYAKICEEFEFEHIKKDNLGVCGGRQFVAEHSDELGYDYHLFFEDDMMLHSPNENLCKNHFPQFVFNLLQTLVDISEKEEFDFLKFSFTEFYGDNGTQWAWYNVPQVVREEIWPEYNKLPITGLDPNAPRTEFKNIKYHSNTSYLTGQIYYSNWPQLVSKEGNRKMFLNTKWAHPYEQTWMSHIFQETLKGNIKPGLLLASPVNHNRFDHYDGKLRKES
jgi:hypothetical protein